MLLEPSGKRLGEVRTIIDKWYLVKLLSKIMANVNE